MRAAVFVEAGLPLVVEEIDDVRPDDGEVIIRVASAGICGSDLHSTSDRGGAAPGAVLGHEFAGEVAALGAGVAGLSVGDLVCAMPLSGCGSCHSCVAGAVKWCARRRTHQGGYAEYVVAGADTTFVLPPGLSPSDGALVEPMSVGLHGVNRARLRPGARVLVMGAGPVGLAAALWSRHLGARAVAVAATSDRRASIALSMGATDFIVSSDELETEVSAVLRGRPDVVFECTGAPGMLERAVGCVQDLGTVVVLGQCNDEDRWRPAAALRKEVSVVFAHLYTKQEFELCMRQIADGLVEPRTMVTRRIGLDALPEVLETLRSGRSPDCKVLVEPNGRLNGAAIGEHPDSDRISTR
jgi:threonine dehydrogenase-like Zn-dependent dehydrogenase